MQLPLPDLPLSIIAARIAEKACIPAAISAIEIPDLTRSLSVPVIDKKPDSAWTNKSYAFLSLKGPSEPYPEILQTINFSC